MLRESWQEIRLKKREKQEEEKKMATATPSDNRQKSLNLDQMQGAFWILLLGALVASGAFLGELIVAPG